jgi:nucleotide-binding universal stress UspA family protein
MNSQIQIILVPTDFTAVALHAIEHAVKYSKLLKRAIVLLHIIKKDQDYQEAEIKIKAEAGEIISKYGIKVETLIREGSIFTTIGEVSNELEADLVIMGTHGIHGMQKLTGSWALKVAVKSKAPVIVVQEAPKREQIRRLVFPIDFKKENKEKIGWACFMAKLFDAKILVFKSNSKDRGFLRGIISNFTFSEKYFKNHDVDYEVFTAEPKKNFHEQTMEFARKTDADMILIVTTKAINYGDYIFGAPEQHIIANEAKIPVMCVNPKPKKVGDFSATGN